MNEEIKYLIYRAFDTTNGLCYIGMTKEKRYVKRKGEHHREYKLTDHFHNALKVRPETFEWSVLESGLSFEQAKIQEMFWIKHYDSFTNGYNNTEGGDGTQGLYGEKNHFYGKHHTEESKRKISQNHDYSHMRGEGNPNYGREYTAEERAQLSAQAKKLWDERGNELRLKLQQSNGKAVRCIETGVVYPSAREAERQTGCRHDCIGNCCNGRQKSTKGLHWEFA